jgi:hypothetical protein
MKRKAKKKESLIPADTIETVEQSEQSVTTEQEPITVEQQETTEQTAISEQQAETTEQTATSEQQPETTEQTATSEQQPETTEQTATSEQQAETTEQQVTAEQKPEAIEQPAEKKSTESKEKEKEKKEEFAKYEVLDGSEAAGFHKKRGRKKASEKNNQSENSDPLGDIPLTKEELFEILIDGVEMCNMYITAMFTGKEPERYRFNLMMKGALLWIASKQKKFFFNMNFVRESWFFLGALIGVIIATQIQVIIVDKMENEFKESE